MAAARDATRRKTAEERREEIVRIAIEHFALGGYNGTSTEAIARDAGISQPYLFRLFKTKRELFIACYEEMHLRVRSTFQDAAKGRARDAVLDALGSAYVALLGDRTVLLFQIQSYGACADPVIRERVRECFSDLVKLVARASGAEAREVWRFFANGMLLNVIASLDLDAIADRESWAREWLDPAELVRAIQEPSAPR